MIAKHRFVDWKWQCFEAQDYRCAVPGCNVKVPRLHAEWRIGTTRTRWTDLVGLCSQHCLNMYGRCTLFDKYIGQPAANDDQFELPLTGDSE